VSLERLNFYCFITKRGGGGVLICEVWGGGGGTVTEDLRAFPTCLLRFVFVCGRPFANIQFLCKKQILNPKQHTSVCGVKLETETKNPEPIIICKTPKTVGNTTFNGKSHFKSN
jgi:hypothetical protein